MPRYEWMNVQRAKKVVSNSPGLVNIVLDLPKGQVKFFEEFKLGYSRKNPHTPDGWGAFLTPPLTWIS